MTGKSIETDEKPCPLTVSEWIALLTAEDHAESGYKHLAVTMTFAAFPILMAAYAATRFETFGLLMKLISVVAFLVAFTALIYLTKLTINMFKERDKNSEIIEEIIAGNLTDPDEIRKRWRDGEAPANAE